MKRNKPKSHRRFYDKTILIALCLIISGIIVRSIYLSLLPFRLHSVPDIPPITNFEQYKKPNIVLILLDDLDDTVTPFYEAMPVTKKLIKDRGMTFINSFSPNPLCCPARASLLTGKYSHNTGVYNNDGISGGWQQFYKNGNEEKTLAVYLKKNGYNTSHVGKYLNGFEENPTHTPPGWTNWQGGVGRAIYTGYNYTLNENGKIVKYGSDAKDYLTDVISRKAAEFIQNTETEDEKPFFLSLAPTAPHYPLLPAARHRNHPFRKAVLPDRLNYNEIDLSDKSSWLKDSAFTRSIFLLSTNWDYRHRMGSLYAVDEMVAVVLESLYKNGELNNTYIIFTSDNGYNNGAHKLIQKMAPYEESQRVPLVISGPGIKKTTDDRFVLTIDLAPTILELAGLDTPSDMDGMSIKPILFNEENVSWRKDFLAQHKIGGLASEFVGYPWLLNFVTEFIDVPSYTALRTYDHMFIEWQMKDGELDYELYDMKKDPYQLNNLLIKGEGKYRELLGELEERLDRLKTCKGISCRINNKI